MYELIKKMAKEKGISINSLEKELDFSKGSLCKIDINIPSSIKIQKLANYFGVSAEYLTGHNEETFQPDEMTDESVFYFSVLGMIKAGYDDVIEEALTDETVPLPVSALKGRSPSDFFMLRVKGNSMYPRFIEGDKVLVQRCSSVDSGTIAVILYNGEEATLKKVVYMPGEDWFELIAINPEYAPKRVEGADLAQCRVLGKVVKLIRDI